MDVKDVKATEQGPEMIEIKPTDQQEDVQQLKDILPKEKETKVDDTKVADAGEAENKIKNFEWPALESNPQVLTDYMHKIGMSKDWLLEEVYGMDQEMVQTLQVIRQPIVGVVAALQRKDPDPNDKSLVPYEELDQKQFEPKEGESIVSFFMEQTEKLNNACSIVACLHIILNHLDFIQLENGSTLADIAGRKKEEIAEVVATNEQMQEECQEQAEKNETKEVHGTNHHFVAYVVNDKNQLVELDGQRKEGPKIIKEGCSRETLLENTANHIQALLAAGKLHHTLSLLTLNYNNDM